MFESFQLLEYGKALSILEQLTDLIIKINLVSQSRGAQILHNSSFDWDINAFFRFIASRKLTPTICTLFRSSGISIDRETLIDVFYDYLADEDVDVEVIHTLSDWIGGLSASERDARKEKFERIHSQDAIDIINKSVSTIGKIWQYLSSDDTTKSKIPGSLSSIESLIKNIISRYHKQNQVYLKAKNSTSTTQTSLSLCFSAIKSNDDKTKFLKFIDQYLFCELRDMHIKQINALVQKNNLNIDVIEREFDFHQRCLELAQKYNAIEIVHWLQKRPPEKELAEFEADSETKKSDDNAIVASSDKQDDYEEEQKKRWEQSRETLEITVSLDEAILYNNMPESRDHPSQLVIDIISQKLKKSWVDELAHAIKWAADYNQPDLLSKLIDAYTKSKPSELSKQQILENSVYIYTAHAICLFAERGDYKSLEKCLTLVGIRQCFDTSGLDANNTNERNPSLCQSFCDEFKEKVDKTNVNCINLLKDEIAWNIYDLLDVIIHPNKTVSTIKTLINSIVSRYGNEYLNESHFAMDKSFFNISSSDFWAPELIMLNQKASENQQEISLITAVILSIKHNSCKDNVAFIHQYLHQHYGLMTNYSGFVELEGRSIFFTTAADKVWLEKMQLMKKFIPSRFIQSNVRVSSSVILDLAIATRQYKRIQPINRPIFEKYLQYMFIFDEPFIPQLLGKGLGACDPIDYATREQKNQIKALRLVERVSQLAIECLIEDVKKTNFQVYSDTESFNKMKSSIRSLVVEDVTESRVFFKCLSDKCCLDPETKQRPVRIELIARAYLSVIDSMIKNQVTDNDNSLVSLFGVSSKSLKHHQNLASQIRGKLNRLKASEHKLKKITVTPNTETITDNNIQFTRSEILQSGSIKVFKAFLLTKPELSVYDLITMTCAEKNSEQCINEFFNYCEKNTINLNQSTEELKRTFDGLWRECFTRESIVKSVPISPLALLSLTFLRLIKLKKTDPGFIRSQNYEKLLHNFFHTCSKLFRTYGLATNISGLLIPYNTMTLSPSESTFREYNLITELSHSCTGYLFLNDLIEVVTRTYYYNRHFSIHSLVNHHGKNLDLSYVTQLNFSTKEEKNYLQCLSLLEKITGNLTGFNSFFDKSKANKILFHSLLMLDTDAFVNYLRDAIERESDDKKLGLSDKQWQNFLRLFVQTVDEINNSPKQSDYQSLKDSIQSQYHFQFSSPPSARSGAQKLSTPEFSTDGDIDPFVQEDKLSSYRL